MEKYDVIEDKEIPAETGLAVMLIITLVLATYQLLFNNLMINMRFKIKVM